ncbi:cysteine desulfurase-like protein [Pelagibius sp. Alg239-R121]|uniref:cysteine desulfurase-like protein n=1 Tax=Pelagibius sp. Alg239-R121 TaxID=2993448 RepID=UPI0024A756F5|nr:cysteine desulfurase-like protein [Pelagibius sp. Alg239-R121]
MTFPIERVRSAFPALAITDGGEARIYLDNPAGTQVPQHVVDAISSCLIGSNANLGGYFPTSLAAGSVVDDAHQAMADFLGARSADEIIIGANMTSLTFHLARSICRDFKPGDEILLTRMDHEGNVAPWLTIAEDLGLVVKWLPFDTETWQVEPDALEAALSDRTRLIALNYASNLTGSINDVKALTAMAKAAGALVFIDAVQLAPHRSIDVQDIGCDFLACSSYKFFGPHLGIIWGSTEVLRNLPAYKCRCVGEELMGKFETGTPQIELLAGLTATVDYYAWLGKQIGGDGSRRAQILAAFDAAHAYERPLAGQLIEGLLSIPDVTIHGITNLNRIDHRVPTVSFSYNGHKPAFVSKALSDQNIFIWDGHNYALEVVRQLGIPEDEGIVRIGIAHYNTEDEVDRALECLAAIGK